MFAGVVDQHVEAVVFGDDSLHRFFPGGRLGHIQIDAPATARRFLSQLIRLIAPRVDPEPDEILRRLSEKGSSDGRAQTSIGAGDEDDAGTHSFLCNRAVEICQSRTTKCAPIACSLEPTTLTVAAGC